MTDNNKTELLTRDEFRESVFSRDSFKCLFCDQSAVDAHHIIERRLFPDGGYYINNGASLCMKHHLEAEMTTLSCEEIREAAGIKKIILPPHLYESQRYDKWGNPILQNGQRLKGDLFFDESVQKILKDGGALYLFTNYVKYPRTYHLPWSPGVTKDDRVIESTDIFEGKNVVVTIKLDGENTTFYNDYIHARAVDSTYNGEWRTWAKNIWASIAHDIPEGWRLCCENLQAKHSIKYTDLDSFIYLFSVWDKNNFCLSWNETKEWASLLNLSTVPVLYEGIWDENIIKKLYTEQYENNDCEGYVVRLSDKFYYSDFRKSCAKYVRAEHVNSSRHWKYDRLEFNELKKEF